MEPPKEIIELAEHVKNKIKSHRISPLSFASDEFDLSEIGSISSTQLLPRRSSTFVTYRMEQVCQECLQRENLFQEENRQLARAYEENRKLNERIHSSVLLNRQYQEEIDKLNILIHESQMNLTLLKQKVAASGSEDNQIKRLRHEVQIYNQFILTKRKEEPKHNDYFYQFRKK